MYFGIPFIVIFPCNVKIPVARIRQFRCLIVPHCCIFYRQQHTGLLKNVRNRDHSFTHVRVLTKLVVHAAQHLPNRCRLKSKYIVFQWHSFLFGITFSMRLSNCTPTHHLPAIPQSNIGWYYCRQRFTKSVAHDILSEMNPVTFQDLNDSVRCWLVFVYLLQQML